MPRRLLAGLALVAACGTPPAPPPPPRAQPPVEKKTDLPPPRADGRLPELASPVSYALHFDVDPSSPRFAGTERIEIDVPARTSYVVLDARDLDVADARAIVGGETRVAHVSTRAPAGSKHRDELVLTFDRALPPGRATLALSWTATYGEELSGLYRVKDGDRWYAYTQLEATAARRAFPCFDEPGYKVPFEVSVTAPRGLLALANTREVARDDAAATTTYRFAPTPPMPTYLVALAVGDFDVVESPRTHAPPIRLVATKGKGALSALALEATGALVDDLSGWFGIPYPYDKLDVVAVPEFAAGAMENPGLVTFREELLLLDPARASVRARRSQALVIAHELAHQWFGDLVTAAWWNDIWLNEGMASWMEWRAVDRWQPTWGAAVDAVVSGQGVMDMDALATARAVRQPVRSTSEAHEAFDAITYEKGAAVLSTIERWIGPDTFQRAVRDYLSANAWKSVHADALMSALDRASGKDVSAMAAGFLDRAGVPEVTAHLACDRGGRWHAELGQQMWRPLGTKAPDEPDRAWTIPVCVRAEGAKADECIELAAGAPSLVAGRSCPKWIHPNAAAGYFRFSLGERDTLRLAAARASLDVPERVLVVTNAWAAVRAGELSPAAMLRVLPSFDAERSRQAVDATIVALDGMSNALVEEDARPAFRAFAKARLAPHMKRLGWEPKKDEASGDDAMLRRSVIAAMGDIAEDEQTLREADELASKWLADPASVDADTGAVSLDLASRHAGPARLEQLRAAAKSAKTREDRVVVLRAMGGFDDPETLKAALDVTLTDEIRQNEVRYVLLPALWRRKARATGEAWVREHWDALRKKLPGALGAGLVRAAAVGCSEAEAKERAAFYTPRVADIEGAARPLAESLEDLSLCAELRAKSAAALTTALAGKKSPAR